MFDYGQETVAQMRVSKTPNLHGAGSISADSRNLIFQGLLRPLLSLTLNHFWATFCSFFLLFFAKCSFASMLIEGILPRSSPPSSEEENVEIRRKGFPPAFVSCVGFVFGESPSNNCSVMILSNFTAYRFTPK